MKKNLSPIHRLLRLMGYSSFQWVRGMVNRVATVSAGLTHPGSPWLRRPGSRDFGLHAIRKEVPMFVIVKLVPAAAFCLVILTSASQADEKKIPLNQVPRAVLDAVKARFVDAKLVGAETETEEGKTVYEIAITHKDQKIEVEVTPDGKITEYEKKIAAKDLPKAATDVLEGKYPQATYKVVEEVTKVQDGQEKLAYYEVLLVTAANKKFEVVVTPQGKITKEEDKNKEKKE
jgi:hypothetical protein